MFEADALLKFETNLKGKVENVNAPLSNKENNTTLSKFTKLIILLTMKYFVLYLAQART